MNEFTIRIPPKEAQDNNIEEAESALTYAIRENHLYGIRFEEIWVQHTETGWIIRVKFLHRRGDDK